MTSSDHIAESMKEASDAFRESLSCLSNDAAIIRQLSSLQIATGIITAQESATSSNIGLNSSNSTNSNNDSNSNRYGNEVINTNPQDYENMDPNIDYHQSEPKKPQPSQSQIHNLEINKSMIQQLNGIHTILSQLESKVSTISHVLKEEQSAMQSLLQTKSSALGQTQIITDIIQNLEDQELHELLPGNGLLKINHSLDTLGILHHHDSQNTNHNHNTNAKIGSNSNISNGVKGQVHKTSHKKYMKAKTNLPEIILRPITQAEFQSVSKNTRGRITLSALNEALHDIQKVTLQKYSHIHNPHSHRKGSSSSSHVNSIGNGPMHPVHKEGGEDLPFVSEQDLRDDCAFFVTGESTARAILQILRSCKRIKQVFWTGTGMDSAGIVSGSAGLNGNGALVTYVWLNGQD